VTIVVFFELGLFVKQQFLDLPTLRGVGSDFEQFQMMLNVLSYHETLHGSLRARSLPVSS